MVTRFFAGIATFAAILALALSWIGQTRNEKQSRQIQDDHVLLGAVAATQSAQGKLSRELVRSQLTILRALSGRRPRRALASTP